MSDKVKKKWIDGAMATDDELASEANLRQTADSSHQAQITANATAIATETTNRQNADSNLQSQINANSTAIATETTNRQNADTALQNQITTNTNNITTNTNNISSIVTNFASNVRSAALTGIVFTVATAITATDTVLSALGKLQAQITRIFALRSQVWDASNSTAASTSSTATWVTHSSIVQTLENGDYRVEVNYDGQVANNGRSMEIRLVHNGVALYTRTRYGTNLAETLTGSRFFKLTNLPAQQHTFEFQFRVGSSGATTATINESKISLIREGN